MDGLGSSIIVNGFGEAPAEGIERVVGGAAKFIDLLPVWTNALTADYGSGATGNTAMIGFASGAGVCGFASATTGGFGVRTFTSVVGGS